MKVLSIILLSILGLLSLCEVNEPSKTRNIQSVSGLFLNSFKHKFEQAVDHVGGHTQCAKDLKALLKNLVLLRRWAIKMIDASAKIPPGVFNGNYIATGDYDQCLEVKVTEKSLNITGQYCSVVILPSSKFSNEVGLLFDAAAFSEFIGMKRRYQMSDLVKFLRATFGLCIPNSCSISNLQKLWDYIEITFRVPVHMHFMNVLCNTADKTMEIYSHDKCIFFIFAVYGAILLIATIYDVFYHNKSDGEANMLVCFSVYSNCKKLFSYAESPGDVKHYLDSLNGLKVIGMLWIVYAHRALFSSMSSTNAVYVHKVWKFTLPGIISTAAVMSVDMFFSFSGLLLSYGYLTYTSTVARVTNTNLFAVQLYRLLR
ncbi:unnamed protein product [Callosobruchus maculatus]|uniref:Nose resistant-to-fluoxetine protein N-terminal domain-containing protein n=1 Tax=Callosobruchus maculatus TaxID=64391 RepID=A0A653BPV0_CALMS|nr:unnamed protein product [Callosobruchus maculatus]